MGWNRKRRSSGFSDVFGMNKALRELDRDLFGRYGLVTVACKIAYSAYKTSQRSHRYNTSINTYPAANCLSVTKKYQTKIKRGVDKSLFKEEIALLENKITTKTSSISECERLAHIYYRVEDYFNERRIRLMVLYYFLKECDLEDKFDSIVNAFNDPCKQPPKIITDNRLINEDYQILLGMAEKAKQRWIHY